MSRAISSRVPGPAPQASPSPADVLANSQSVPSRRRHRRRRRLRAVAINKFLETNDPAHLEPFVGLGLRDTRKRFWPFETRPNVLRKLDSAGELSFVELYRQTVQ
jgi:hypothetical protein